MTAQQTSGFQRVWCQNCHHAIRRTLAQHPLQLRTGGYGVERICIHYQTRAVLQQSG